MQTQGSDPPANLARARKPADTSEQFYFQLSRSAKCGIAMRADSPFRLAAMRPPPTCQTLLLPPLVMTPAW